MEHTNTTGVRTQATTVRRHRELFRAPKCLASKDRLNLNTPSIIAVPLSVGVRSFLTDANRWDC